MLSSAIKRARAASFETKAVLGIATLALMCAAAWWLPEPADRGVLRRPLQVFQVMHRRQLTRDQLENMTAGYYDGIFRQGEQTAQTNDLISGQWQWSWSNWKPLHHIYPIHHIRHDFLYYELKPNLNEPEFGVTLVTNSLGMPDQEYALQAAPGTRRIALIGDSLTRGLGAAFGRSYEALLEDELNRNYTTDRVRRYEILNFACEGYRVEQFYEVAQVKAAPFAPDVYVVALSQLATVRRYGDHICQLLQEGIDLKYSYLKELVQKTGIRPDDSLSAIDAKLAPYAVECAGWFMEQMREFARQQHAQLLVLLIPPVVETDLVVEHCRGLKAEVERLGIPIVDVLETYRGVEDLDAYRISKHNIHQNDAGQQLLFESLLRHLKSQPAAWQILTGQPSVP